jgi:hypothetical protein
MAPRCISMPKSVSEGAWSLAEVYDRVFSIMHCTRAAVNQGR